MPMMLVYIGKYQKNSGIGTVISLMMPYALLFPGIWILMIIAWYLIGLPLGPGVPVRWSAYTAIGIMKNRLRMPVFLSRFHFQLHNQLDAARLLLNHFSQQCSNEDV